jgi:arginyl-tRNA synthetase
MKQFREEVAKAIEKATRKKVDPRTLSVPPSSEMGDLASNVAFQTGEKNPKDAAGKIAKKIKPSGLIARVRAAGPYVNFFLDREKFSKEIVTEILEDKASFGKGVAKRGLAMVEFSQPNTHKAFHIGHLRGTSLGDSLCRIMQHAGYAVSRANYQGDVGAHVAKCLWALQRFHASRDNWPDHRGRWLGEVYAEASLKVKENPEFEKEVQEVFRKLYFDKEPKLVALWKETRDWSLREFDEIYKRLGVSFDAPFFESEVEEDGVELVRELASKGLAYEDQGAILIDLEKHKLPKFLLLRSDGTPLYSTKELALAKRKFEEFDVDRSIVITASEQKLYFQQVFATLREMGFAQAEKCVHIPFELVMLPTGKMKSRTGEVIVFEDIANEAVARVKKEIEKKNPDLADKDEVAEAVGIGALKYWMLRVSNNKTIIFDWDKALDFTGETGPYVQYAHVRCAGILEKARKKPKPGEAPEAHELLVELSNFPDVVEAAAETRSPHLLANYSYRVADAFSKFYEKNPVIGSKNEEALLAVVAATKQVLALALSLLGMKAPEKM